MPYRLFQKVFKNKDMSSQFKIVSWLFVLSLVALVLTAGFFLFRSSQNANESAQIACEAVQDNNQILRNYLFETEERAIGKIKHEKNPPYSIKEIKESYHPLIQSLARKSCTGGRENGGKR